MGLELCLSQAMAAEGMIYVGHEGSWRWSHPLTFLHFSLWSLGLPACAVGSDTILPNT